MRNTHIIIYNSTSILKRYCVVKSLKFTPKTFKKGEYLHVCVFWMLNVDGVLLECDFIQKQVDVLCVFEAWKCLFLVDLVWGFSSRFVL